MTQPLIAQWVSDLAIGLSYFAISTGLVFALKASTMRLPKLFLGLFASFIVLCGVGHLIDAWYGYAGQCSQGQSWKVLVGISTAFASVGTAITTLPRLGLYVPVTELPARIVILEAEVKSLKEALRASSRQL